LVVGEIHGNEPAGRDVVRALRHLGRGFRRVAVWTVLTVNPDGHRADVRGNAHGVDLNRNFSYRWSGSEPPGSGYYAGPSPFSEPESRAVRRLVRRIEPDLTVWFHQPWDAVLACGSHHRVESRFAQIAGMGVECRGEGLPGTATSWEEHHFPASNAFVVEFHSGTLSSSELRRATRATAHVAAKGAAK
jgi:protein MpaA